MGEPEQTDPPTPHPGHSPEEESGLVFSGSASSHLWGPLCRRGNSGWAGGFKASGPQGSGGGVGLLAEGEGPPRYVGGFSAEEPSRWEIEMSLRPTGLRVNIWYLAGS